MTSTYVIRLTDRNGAELESWLGGKLIIGPDGAPVAIDVASLGGRLELS